MAVISVTVPDAVLPRVVDAFATTYGYQTLINGSPNPQTKAQFAKQKLMDYMKDVTRAYEASIAADTARSTAVTKVDNEISLT